eukprot:9066420-Pyramimonas_sp.AAC.1
MELPPRASDQRLTHLNWDHARNEATSSMIRLEVDPLSQYPNRYGATSNITPSGMEPPPKMP